MGSCARKAAGLPGITAPTEGKGLANEDAEVAVDSATKGGDNVTPNGPLKPPPAPAEK